MNCFAAFICGKSILDAKGQLQSGKQSSTCISYFVAAVMDQERLGLILAVVAHGIFFVKR